MALFPQTIRFCRINWSRGPASVRREPMISHLPPMQRCKRLDKTSACHSTACLPCQMEQRIRSILVQSSKWGNFFHNILLWIYFHGIAVDSAYSWNWKDGIFISHMETRSVLAAMRFFLNAALLIISSSSERHDAMHWNNRQAEAICRWRARNMTRIFSDMSAPRSRRGSYVSCLSHHRANADNESLL